MTTAIQPTYTERAGKLAKKARVTAVRQMEKLIVRAKDALTSGQIKGINLLREAGEKANQAAGRNQLLFNLEGLEFCRKEILPLIKSGITLKEIQLAVHIRAKLEKPIESAEELKAFKAECKASQVLMGFADESTREGQSLIERNLFCTLTTAARKFELLLEDLEKEKPMEEWESDALDEFLESTVPVQAKIEKAKQLKEAMA